MYITDMLQPEVAAKTPGGGGGIEPPVHTPISHVGQKLRSQQFDLSKSGHHPHKSERRGSEIHLHPLYTTRVSRVW